MPARRASVLLRRHTALGIRQSPCARERRLLSFDMRMLLFRSFQSPLLSMKSKSLAVCSASGTFHLFDDADEVVLFMSNRRNHAWNVYKCWRGEWHWIPIEEGMTASQVREVILKA